LKKIKAIKKSAFQEGQDISKIEKLNEKELRFKSSSFTVDNEFSTDMDTSLSTSATAQKWPVNGLTPIDLPDTIIVPEIRSDENEIQTKREQNTLAVLVFKQFCPDSASEPNDADSKSSLDTVTKIIPLEDVTLNGQTQASLQEAANMPDEEETPMNIEETDLDSKNQKDFRGNNSYNRNYNNNSDNKYYNSNQKNDYRNYKNNTYKGGNSGNSNNSNNNSSNSTNGNNRGYYNQQHHQQQKRQQFQQKFQQQKSGIYLGFYLRHKKMQNFYFYI
jgi:hypothetical protein